jgi:hypothetical protein
MQILISISDMNFTPPHSETIRTPKDPASRIRMTILHLQSRAIRPLTEPLNCNSEASSQTAIISKGQINQRKSRYRQATSEDSQTRVSRGRSCGAMSGEFTSALSLPDSVNESTRRQMSSIVRRTQSSHNNISGLNMNGVSTSHYQQNGIKVKTYLHYRLIQVWHGEMELPRGRSVRRPSRG